jgi:3-deoxy-D-manno-octulosonic-acid transferase
MPVILVVAHVFALFSKKIRSGLFPRYSTISSLKRWTQEQSTKQKRILFHAASLGEFEHIKPLLQELKEKYNTLNVVTFFSPSGYNHVKKFEGLDFHMYMPIDRATNWNALHSLLKPSLVVIAKHDVWPAQIWTARENGIPIFLVNASLPANSSRTKLFVKQFLSHVYSDFNAIFSISKDDAQRFSYYFPNCTVEVIGDTKYDQVVLRKRTALKQNLIPNDWVTNKWILVAGSVWPEDAEHIFPAFVKILDKYPNVKLVIVPHQPHEKALEKIDQSFAAWNRIRFSQLDNHENERILIVDAVGYLAGIYRYAQAAYVGGSFKQGVHNVMEPAIFGIPVLYGPVHKNSYEAIKLAAGNGGITIENSQEVFDNVEKFLNDDDLRKAIGGKAQNFATGNTGATQNLLNIWEELLAEKNR